MVMYLYCMLANEGKGRVVVCRAERGWNTFIITPSHSIRSQRVFKLGLLEFVKKEDFVNKKIIYTESFFGILYDGDAFCLMAYQVRWKSSEIGSMRKFSTLRAGQKGCFSS